MSWMLQSVVISTYLTQNSTSNGCAIPWGFDSPTYNALSLPPLYRFEVPKVVNGAGKGGLTNFLINHSIFFVLIFLQEPPKLKRILTTSHPQQLCQPN